MLGRAAIQARYRRAGGLRLRSRLSDSEPDPPLPYPAPPDRSGTSLTVRTRLCRSHRPVDVQQRACMNRPCPRRPVDEGAQTNRFGRSPRTNRWVGALSMRDAFGNRGLVHSRVADAHPGTLGSSPRPAAGGACNGGSALDRTLTRASRLPARRPGSLHPAARERSEQRAEWVPVPRSGLRRLARISPCAAHCARRADPSTPC